MDVSNERVVELMSPAMYWISQMEGEIRLVAKGEYAMHINRTDREFTYRDRLLEVFGEELVEQLINLSRRTFKEYESLVTLVYETLQEKWDTDGDIHGELEDVIFWSGEIMFSLRRIREMLQLMGYVDSVEDMMYALGLEFLSTTAE